MSQQNPENPTDPIWRMHMQTLMKRKRVMEISEKLDQAFHAWYSERGLEVPCWRQNKDPQWWIDYLRELGQRD
jgi:alkyl sulfatase BDS1-like metallo-beta-lactamase superfamily hydrolase